MFSIRPLPLSLVIGTILTQLLIAKVDATYTCRMQTINDVPKLPNQEELSWRSKRSIASKWGRLLDIDRNLPVQQITMVKEIQECNSRTLFLPVPPRNLTFPTVEVLPNRLVCLNGILQNECMPKYPVAFPVDGGRGSLILSSRELSRLQSELLTRIRY